MTTTFTLTLTELINIIRDGSEAGVANYIKSTSPKEDMISERKAFKAFGEANVKNWVKQSLVASKRNGSAKNSTKNYSYSELLIVARAERTMKLVNK